MDICPREGPGEKVMITLFLELSVETSTKYGVIPGSGSIRPSYCAVCLEVTYRYVTSK
ncbi:hypothetical protein TRIATDRAFT_259379 [Trichoderma atroviride IMI 206040]|uniref:Uncharacterized protein n=1 Tax=Hypocrea atroviridis (strain ATCC 20476 / IMI 206040) TaxID=452589 RepID=G9P797_HYPAI|nr:uncharacterized protein TRIATDRAFT_302049 [Trichoderma atroviride IMI 206040]EHK41546.1 hypothetical protein TRIATDRAFT_259379 [Trichoderma atroviride IMI 206040]